MSDASAAARGRLAAAGLSATEWANGPGDRYAAHAHDYDKVLVAVAGAITFRLPLTGAAHVLVAGDRLDLPAGTLHAADVGPDGVRCLEAHLPAGSLHPEPRRMADWATTASAGAGRETDGDRET
jgi:quercetin dioxygenase-like cupin family protein